ncbi:MAG: ABC transporter substrate-binding protein [Alphaproteobacteria bacterium]
MADLKMKMACGPYDRMDALRYGHIKPEGIELDYLSVGHPHEIFARMVATEEFDVCEMSGALYLTQRSLDRFPFIAIPVFPSRVFRHGNIYINRNSGIETPKDLEGKRIGLQEYRQTAALWIRGFLRDEYDVDTDSIHWIEGGTNVPRKANPQMDLRPDRELSIAALGDTKTLSAALADGRIDCLLGAQKPDCFGVSDDVVRLFPDYRATERDYFARTGHFPIMHTMVFREKLYRDNPWIAESMFRACEASKQAALEQMRFSGALCTMSPWLPADMEEIDELFGGECAIWWRKASCRRPRRSTICSSRWTGCERTFHHHGHRSLRPGAGVA